MRAAVLFYGSAETASPRTRTEFPNYQTGDYTAPWLNALISRLSSDCQRLSAITVALGVARSRETLFPAAAKGFPINSDVKISSPAVLTYSLYILWYEVLSGIKH